MRFMDKEDSFDELCGLTFDPAHLRQVLLDDEIWDKLPSELKYSFKGIQHFAATIMTSLDRYKKLRAEAPDRGWPQHSTYPR